MTTIKPVIFGLSSTELSVEEAAFFQETNPLGFIIFRRNVQDQAQLKKLTDTLRTLLDRPDMLILVDQEGGRVARLREAQGFHKLPPAAFYGALYKENPDIARAALQDHAALTAYDLKECGINVNCAPVVDLRHADAHDVIGDRSFGATVPRVVTLARDYAMELMHYGIAPIIKHIPGHGRAKSDSHWTLPRVDTDLPTLMATDFAVFKELNDLPFAMTAHVVYTMLDPDLPVTLSKKAVDFIRDVLGFQGVLMSDALEMEALQGDFSTRARDAQAAGIDILLHCSGKLDEMRQVVAGIAPWAEESYLRYTQAMEDIKHHTTAVASKGSHQESLTETMTAYASVLAALQEPICPLPDALTT